jgi:hypothetical protein
MFFIWLLHSVTHTPRTISTANSWTHQHELTLKYDASQTQSHATRINNGEGHDDYRMVKRPFEKGLLKSNHGHRMAKY